MSLHLGSSYHIYYYLSTVSISSFTALFLIILLFTSIFSLNNMRVRNVGFEKSIVYGFLGFLGFLLVYFCIKSFFTLYYTLALHSGEVMLRQFLTMFSDTLIILAFAVTVVSWVYLSERFLFRMSFNIFYFSIFGLCTLNLVYTPNLLLLFIYFELLFLPSLYFVYQYGYAKKVDKTISFLLKWTLSGSFLVLLGLAVLYTLTFTLDFSALQLIQFSSTESFCFALVFFVGFGIKIPVWPFYYWLTKVHVEAPTGFSIFLSGFLVKTAFYCFLYFYYLFKTPLFVIIVTGVTVWGVVDASLRMWGSIDIKRLIAFATIQEMNLILFFLILLNSQSYTFLNLFLLVHGLLSALLFFLIDQVQKGYDTRNLTQLGGLALEHSSLIWFIWASLLIFRGFPIFIKFIIEWELAHMILTHFSIFGLIVFCVVSLAGVLGFARVWFIILYGNPKTNLETGGILKRDMYIALSLISILIFLNITVLFFLWLVF